MNFDYLLGGMYLISILVSVIYSLNFPNPLLLRGIKTPLGLFYGLLMVATACILSFSCLAGLTILLAKPVPEGRTLMLANKTGLMVFAAISSVVTIILAHGAPYGKRI